MCVYVLLVDSIRILSILAELLNFITSSCGKSPVVLQNVLSFLCCRFSFSRSTSVFVKRVCKEEDVPVHNMFGWM